jgi:hypothetical protein
VRQLHILYIDLNPYDLISPETAEKERNAQGPAQPFEKARFVARKDLGFCFPWLGFSLPQSLFSFPKAWIFLPRFAQKGELSGPTELDER